VEHVHGLGELDENSGGIVNYYGGVSCSFGLTLSKLALGCSSKLFLTPSHHKNLV
jgi:hypothetical protein